MLPRLKPSDYYRTTFGTDDSTVTGEWVYPGGDEYLSRV